MRKYIKINNFTGAAPAGCLHWNINHVELWDYFCVTAVDMKKVVVRF